MKNFYELINHDIFKRKIIAILGKPLIGKNIYGSYLAQRLNMKTLTTSTLISSNPNKSIKDIMLLELSDNKYKHGVVLVDFLNDMNEFEIIKQVMSDAYMELFGVIDVNINSDKLQKFVDKQRAEHPSESSEIEAYFANGLEVYNEKTTKVIEHLNKSKMLISIDLNQIYSSGTDAIKKHIYTSFCQYLVTDYYKKNNITANDQLSYIIQHQHLTDMNRNTILNEFRKYSLFENISKKTGQKRRYVYILTVDIHKYNEIVKIFDQYGIEVLLCSPKITINDIQILLSLKDQTSDPIAILQEKTALLSYSSKDHNNQEDYVYIDVNTIKEKTKCINYSELVVYSLGTDSKIVKKTYETKTKGLIDMSKKSIFCNDIYGWDDVFIIENCNLTYEELKSRNLKYSSRNMNISKWIEERIYYENKIDLKFNPIYAKRAIDFEIDPYTYIDTHKYFSCQEVKQNHLYSALVKIINDGVFFKSSINRRMNNYWSPALNGGIPMVPKTDEIHETTYMTHDFMHFALPDLIFTGHHSFRHKIVYIAWRMMSEAITMGIADMFFVDILAKKGISYDYSKRKIYPLFIDLGVNLHNIDKNELVNNLKKVIYANYRYCLLGDDAPYQQMLTANLKSDENLKQFRLKYDAFYVQDYRWTNSNYNDMVKNADRFRYWYYMIKPHIDKTNVVTIDKIIEIVIEQDPTAFDKNEINNIFDIIFNYVFETKIKPLIIEPVQKNKEQSLHNAFLKYMCGQFMIFAKYNFIPALEFINPLNELLRNQITHGTIKECREYYEKFLGTLLDKNLITSDDMHTYSEIYPIFDPSYLSYDVEITQTIDETMKGILITHNKDNDTNKFHGIMKILLDMTGYEEDIFIYKPNVIVMSKTDIECSDTRITFLIAGISTETSMELIAHGEASVARLTTSKTKSMDEPMYRIYPLVHYANTDTIPQKDYIKKLNHVRYNPKNTNINNEVYNILNSGSKATALTYTMNLGDLHKLFIGRAGFDGNESEMREVVKMMISELQPIYPNIIKTYDEYLNMNNSEKYKPIAPNINILNGEFKTMLTPKCKKIFKQLNINEELPDYLQMTEFRSRITYFTFSQKVPSLEQSLKYLEKIVIELGHLSVTGAFQVLKINDGITSQKTYKKLYEEQLSRNIKNIMLEV